MPRQCHVLSSPGARTLGLPAQVVGRVAVGFVQGLRSWLLFFCVTAAGGMYRSTWLLGNGSLDLWIFLVEIIHGLDAQVKQLVQRGQLQPRS